MKSSFSCRRAAAMVLAAAACFASAAGVRAQQAPQAAPPPATAMLHPSDLRQPIYGFGGSQTYNGDPLADFAGREAVYQALFGELKLDIFRLRNYHGYQGQQAKFDKITREFARAARRWSDPKKRGDKGPVRLMFTSWSPPATLKSNNLVSGRSDGTNNGQADVTLKRGADGAYMYGAFADWWLASLRRFRALAGAYPDYIALQNELDWPVAYEGCEFLPSEGVNKDGFAFAGYDRALAAVSDRLNGALGAQAPKIVGPETFSIRLEDGKPRVQLWADPTTGTGKSTLDRLFGVSFHIYGVGAESAGHERFHAALNAVRDTYRRGDGVAKPLFQTEFLEGDSLISLAEMIHDTLVEGEASAYFVWISARSVAIPGYALVYYRPQDNTIERRERFYAMKHFSAFVGEGWNRVAAECSDSAVKLSAFVGPRRDRLAVVLINPTNETRRVTLRPDGDAFAQAATTVYRSSEGEGGERWQELGTLPADSIVILPKRSVATVTFTP